MRCATQSCPSADFPAEIQRTRCTAAPAATHDTVCEAFGWTDECWVDDPGTRLRIGRNLRADHAQSA